MEVWLPGSTPCLHFRIYDSDRQLVDPDSVSVSIYDPHGKAVVEDAPATKISTGVYLYAGWTVNTDSLTGIYTWVPKAIDGQIVVRNTTFQFEVRKEVETR